MGKSLETHVALSAGFLGEAGAVWRFSLVERVEAARTDGGGGGDIVEADLEVDAPWICCELLAVFL